MLQVGDRSQRATVRLEPSRATVSVRTKDLGERSEALRPQAVSLATSSSIPDAGHNLLQHAFFGSSHVLREGLEASLLLGRILAACFIGQLSRASWMPLRHT